MSLITMGYGHLTVATMGLGTSFRIAQQVYSHRYGTVEFRDTTPTVGIKDRTSGVSFKEKKVSVKVDTESKSVTFKGSE